MKIFSESQIETIKKKRPNENQLRDVLSYIDQTCTYEKIIQDGVDNYWFQKNLQHPEQITIDLTRLKLNPKYYKLFFDNTSLWVHNFQLQWILANGELPTIRIIDRATPQKNLSKLISTELGRYVSFSGRVRRISGVNVALIGGSYQCNDCKKIHEIHRMWYEKVKEPRCNCGSRAPLIEHELSRCYQTWQTVTIQQSTEDESGTQLLECRILTPRDFNAVTPGEAVKINGVLRTQVLEKAKTVLYVDLFNIEALEEKSKINVNSKKMSVYEQIKSQKDVLGILSQQLYPEITGLSLIKRLVILQYLSGEGEFNRNSIHLLIAGDAGTGKSQILKQTQKLFGGFYATGLGSSVAGLTASVYKDSDNQWNLDGGAAVLANNNTLYLDEADKMSTVTCNSLLEPMEQQTVSISKAGLTVNLPAKMKMLSASNPKMNQKFDINSGTMLRDQLGFPEPFLSRFDAVVILTEQSQRSTQELIAETVLSPKSKAHQELYLGYLAYAKTKQPTLAVGTKKSISNYYLELKSRFKMIMLTPRVLESLARLCVSMARVKLKDEVDEEDFADVKSLYQESLQTQGLKQKQKPYLLDVNLSKKRENLARTIGDILDHPMTLEDLFVKCSEKEKLLTYDEYSRVIKHMIGGGLIYQPDGLKYAKAPNIEL